MTAETRSEPDAPADWGAPRSKTVTWYDPVNTVNGWAGLSGLEFMQAIAESRLPPPPIALLHNMRPRSVERGVVVFECTPDESVYNPLGIIHGGLVCTLADTVAGCAVQTTHGGENRLHVDRHHRQLPATRHPAERHAGRHRPAPDPGPKLRVDTCDTPRRRSLSRLDCTTAFCILAIWAALIRRGLTADSRT
ncbi:MAG: PaaI family thioesterase [Actinomycetota bacterium]|nr:PaaI family thioesterase [Actinomycetota bacterium]